MGRWLKHMTRSIFFTIIREVARDGWAPYTIPQKLLKLNLEICPTP